MGRDAAAATDLESPAQRLRLGREVLRREGQSLLALAEMLDENFSRALDLLLECRGSVIVSGMGKAGLIGRKIAATLASTGARSHFVHPAEAMHGDLGRIDPSDCCLVLSQSGATEEVARLLPSLVRLGVPIIALTCRPNSPLGQAATVTLDLGPLEEACHLGLAPSTSTTAMLALGDALALVLSRLRRFGPEDFARFHPGGNLGRMLAKVEQIMRPLAECRVAPAGESVRNVLTGTGRAGRRTGAVMLLRDDGTLAGIFTDSDFARLFAAGSDVPLEERLARPIATVMTVSPVCVQAGTGARTAIELMAERKFSELPVIDAGGHPLGLIDITDVVSLSRETPAPTTGHSELGAAIDPPHAVPAPKTLPFVRPAP